MDFIKYDFTHTHVIIRKLKHLKNKINYIIRIINHIFGSEYHINVEDDSKKTCRILMIHGLRCVVEY